MSQSEKPLIEKWKEETKGLHFARKYFLQESVKQDLEKLFDEETSKQELSHYCSECQILIHTIRSKILGDKK